MVGPLCGHEGPAVAQVSKETGVPLVMDAVGADNVTKWDRTPTWSHRDFRRARSVIRSAGIATRSVGLRNVTFIGQDCTFRVMR